MQQASFSASASCNVSDLQVAYVVWFVPVVYLHHARPSMLRHACCLTAAVLGFYVSLLPALAYVTARAYAAADVCRLTRCLVAAIAVDAVHTAAVRGTQQYV